MFDYERIPNFVAGVLLCLLLYLLIERVNTCNAPTLPTTQVVRRDTVVYRDTQYIPIPRYINRVKVVQHNDTVFIRDTTSRGDSITVSYVPYQDTALVDIRYAPERRYVDTVLVREATELRQGIPWWHYILSLLVGIVVGFIIK